MINDSVSSSSSSSVSSSVALPDIPGLVVNARSAHILTTDGEIKVVPHYEVESVLDGRAALVCHAPYTATKMDGVSLAAFDVLELFAFVHPAIFATPTPLGLCKTLGLSLPKDMDEQVMALFDIVRALLTDLQKDPWKAKADPLEIARAMGQNGQGWCWSPFVCAALGEVYDPDVPVNAKGAMKVWKNLPEWAEEAPVPPPSHHSVTTGETEERLHTLLGSHAEERLTQKEYAVQVAGAFQPAPSSQDEGVFNEDKPVQLVLAEAGTGVGKTLGYLAPASVWAEKNQGTVWISTFTKNLQRQIDQELDRVYPNPELKNTHTAIRKGRENYLCLLNLEDFVNGAAFARGSHHVVAAGIMARWAAATKDGDLTGAAFPGWLSGLLGYANTAGLADRRGECIFSACDHYHTCFVERSVRKAERARIVVANHALSMITTALAGPEERLPERYVFDEGHHLFSAADSAFSAHLTVQETQDLRRWIRGAEGGRRSRARGLKRRAEDLCAGDEDMEKALRALVDAAGCLATHGWHKRFKDKAPAGSVESFLWAVYKQVSVRTKHQHPAYSSETEVFPVDESVVKAAKDLQEDLKALKRPMLALVKLFNNKLAQDGGNMNVDMRKRIDALASSLERRARSSVSPWIAMLDYLLSASVQDDQEAGMDEVPPVDWFAVDRAGGKVFDVGFHRHSIDPMRSFSAALKPHAQGVVITSATLRDGTENWTSARQQTGAPYFGPYVLESSFKSPFDYESQARVFIISDVSKNDLGQVAGAYRALFQASGGGALGLFTAINRLRSVHGEIAQDLEQAGLSLYAQHVDDIDTGTLIDMFRDSEHACLLGTDAVRDGVDVPGESLRLMVFDRTPWPRPSILHKARREAFGGRSYDDMITRLKLKQAFGRLIRRADDRGVFIMLDRGLPSKLYDAFPVTPQKVGLAEAVEVVKGFLRRH